MNGKELMIGDWVKNVNCTSPSRVAGITPGKIHTWWADGTRHSKDEVYFNPIPLTAEILEKEEDEEGFWGHFQYLYVHELQQALRLSGFTEMAEKFKI